ncbi:uncharacterized protein LOC117911644 [Vitis riparia]|uniref:uncharacterized protein LOC117911644 n=1 Tax=Vitis riparia TaxID=96939 RepID=UPI00155A379C|nr:uncharacterized protein LOC117911644 [Vitis riparia]
MAMRVINILPPKGPKLHPPSAFFLPTNLPKPGPRTLIHCTNSISDAELASDLATEVKKMNTHLVLRKEAMEKSREMLFTEMCQYLGMGSEEVKRRWRKMGEEEKRVLLKGFISEWGVNFHPLSAKSVKEMVEEYLHEDDPSPHSSSSLSLLFPGLKRMFMGSPSNK